MNETFVIEDLRHVHLLSNNEFHVFTLYLAHFVVASPSFLPRSITYTAWSQTWLAPRIASKSKVKLRLATVCGQ
jgi:hypothetical protein